MNTPRILSVLTSLLLSCPVPVVAGPVEDARAALALAGTASEPCTCKTGGQCRCGEPCGCGTVARADRECGDEGTYDTAYEKAMKAGKPLLVFVRRHPFRYPGAVTVRVEAFPDFDALSGVVVAKPSDDGKKLWRVADLGVNGTAADVRRALSRCPECELANADSGGRATCSTCTGSCGSGAACPPAAAFSGTCGSCSGGRCR